MKWIAGNDVLNLVSMDLLKLLQKFSPYISVKLHFFYIVTIYYKQGYSVSIMTSCGLGDWGLILSRAGILLFASTSRLALDPTQSPAK
jgi:hypothetical protein